MSAENFPYRVRCSRMRTAAHSVAASEREIVVSVRYWNTQCGGEHWRESTVPAFAAACVEDEWPGPVDYFYDPSVGAVPLQEDPEK